MAARKRILLLCSLAVFLPALHACDAAPTALVDDTGPIDLEVSLPVPEFGYQFRSEPFIIQPGQEMNACDIVKIEPKDGERLVWLNAFESRSSDGSHHMNMLAGMFSFGDLFLPGLSVALLNDALGKQLELGGHYDCDELGNLMDAGAQAVYPSQLTHQKATFPVGLGVPIAVPMVVIMNHHYINTTTHPVRVNAAVNFFRMEEKDVQFLPLVFFRGIDDVVLPPVSRKVETRSCTINRDVKLFALSSHSHERGDCFTVARYDGEKEELDPEPFFVNKDWHSPPIMFFDTQEFTGHAAMEMKAGDGVQWACHYKNPEDREVVTGGSAADEMCIFVAIGYPSKLTVADIHAVLDGESDIPASSLLDESVVPCDDAAIPSAWPTEPEPLDTPSHCKELPATLPSVDR